MIQKPMQDLVYSNDKYSYELTLKNLEKVPET